MKNVFQYLEIYGDYARNFLSSIVDPNHRLFFVFIGFSVLLAYLVFKRQKFGTSFLSFLFPKHVWSNPSAMLDVRYFFFHGLIGHFLMYSLATTFLAMGITIGLAGEVSIVQNKTSPFSSILTFVIAATFLLVINLVADFMGFLIHYLQHKIPLLWQFHKVHHAGEVMHPLSNFREHPIDNLMYSIFTSLFQGLVTGVLLRLLGYTPSGLEIFGLSFFNILFNMSAYHLRHSHIWLKWPGVWSKIIASPAHHHVHHSRHPDHLDKNFAFIFPIWDVIFKTYVMPADNKDIEFGIVEDSSDLNSCINLYLIPFRDAFRLFKNTSNKHETTYPSPEMTTLEQPYTRLVELTPEAK